jgi:hypothetical protein
VLEKDADVCATKPPQFFLHILPLRYRFLIV